MPPSRRWISIPTPCARNTAPERDKRLRSDANAQYVEVKGDFGHYIDDPYVEPGFTRAPLDRRGRRR